ncbi:MAG TPA: hypothetical protein VE544_07385 [Nitrososphaeraceae archaeon]|jgi:hypothetical protein|nr:hypothetical protein [Nitrososphaeraceae archaeon]
MTARKPKEEELERLHLEQEAVLQRGLDAERALRRLELYPEFKTQVSEEKLREEFRTSQVEYDRLGKRIEELKKEEK